MYIKMSMGSNEQYDNQKFFTSMRFIENDRSIIDCRSQGKSLEYILYQ